MKNQKSVSNNIFRKSQTYVGDAEEQNKENVNVFNQYKDDMKGKNRQKEC